MQKKVRIIVDSASDMAATRPELTVLPMTVAFGGEEYLDGVKMLDLTNALIVGVILAVIFTVLRPVMRLILSVLNFCTLGLLYIAVDAWLVWTAAGLVENSVVFENYWWALAVAVIINVARTLVDAACGDLKR